MRFKTLKLAFVPFLISIFWTISAAAQLPVDERYLPTEKHQKPQNAKRHTKAGNWCGLTNLAAPRLTLIRGVDATVTAHPGIVICRCLTHCVASKMAL